MNKRTCWVLASVLSLSMVGGCGDDGEGPAGVADAGGPDAPVLPDGGGTDAGGAGRDAGGGATGSDAAALDAGVRSDAAAGGSDAGRTDAGGGDAGASADGPTGASTTDGAASDAGGGATSSKLITAAAGGVVSQGGASVKVPAGALAADAVITLAVVSPTAEQRARGDLSGSIYDLGPDGTTFKAPVEIELPLAEAVPADKEAVVAWLDAATGQWVTTPSTVGAGKVTGQATHFTSFAVLFVGKGGQCPAAPPCGGGIPTGTWEVASACVTQAPPKEAGDCGTTGGKYYARSTYSISGTVTFTGDRYVAAEKLHATTYLTYPAACLAAINQAQPTATFANCAEIQTGLNKNAKAGEPTWACAGSLSEGCSCVIMATLPLDATGTVTVDGTKITFKGDNATKPPVAEDFCIKGNVLTVSSSSAVYTAVKKP
jgi:hypothetical protein